MLNERKAFDRQNVLKPIDFVATLLEGKVKYQKLPSGNSEYMEFYDKNGEMQRGASPAFRQIGESGSGGGGICPCVMVNGVVYYDTGYKGSLNGRCVAVDGQITSECSSSEVLTEDDQSNLGKGYDYQYGSVEGRIEIQMTDGNWYVFVTEEVKANYKP